MKVRGFSIIELIIVIAIVAVLTAIAVPVYKDYAIKAKLASVIPAIQGLVEQARVFQNTHGYYPFAEDLGLGSNHSFPSVVDEAKAAAIIGPYYIQGSATRIDGYQGLNIYGSDPQCSNNGNIYVYLDAEKLGFSDDVVTTLVTGVNANGGIFLECLYGIPESGIFESRCIYGYGTEGVSGLDQLVPGWTNMSTTTSWDGDNFYDWTGWNYPCP